MLLEKACLKLLCHMASVCKSCCRRGGKIRVPFGQAGGVTMVIEKASDMVWYDMV